MLPTKVEHVILFDGTCNFCNFWVHFVIRRDRREKFHFASLRSGVGEDLLNRYGVPREVDSIVVIEKDRYFIESAAVLRIVKELDAPWKWFYLFILIPAPLRNGLYRLIARYRHHLFGGSNTCFIPTERMRKRFLDEK